MIIKYERLISCTMIQTIIQRPHSVNSVWNHIVEWWYVLFRNVHSIQIKMIVRQVKNVEKESVVK